MKQNENLDLIGRLHSKGVHFVANVRTVYGGTDIFLRPDELEAFDANPDAIAAQHLGVSLDVYLAWLSSGGDVQCSKKTQSGRTCLKSISGGVIDNPRDWIQAVQSNPACVQHGGAAGQGR